MKIEMIEFYLTENNPQTGVLRGSLRIRLPDIGVEILGVSYTKIKDRVIVQLPYRKGTHHETGKAVQFPLISLTKPEAMRELINQLRENAPAFVESKLTNTTQASQTLKSRFRPIQPSGYVDIPRKNNQILKPIKT